MNSHTYDEKILVVNKENQVYSITGSRFDTIYDQSTSINYNQFIDRILYESNDIIRIKETTDYALDSDILSFYDNESKAIKYFDTTNGLVYKIEDVVVYDGAFFYKNSDVIPNNKEFAIWDKMHASMQYHDDLPKIFFTQYENKNLMCDYIYDTTSLYIFLNLGPTIDQARVKIKIATCIDLNYNLIQYIDDTFSSDILVEEQVLDFSGLFPSGYIVLERLNRFRDTVTNNRFVKITLDYTFEENNFLNLDVGDPHENPFGSFSLFQQQYESIEYLKTQGYYYNEFLNLTDNITKRLSPTYNYAPWTFNSRTYSWTQPTGTSIDSSMMLDNTRTISWYFDPIDANMNYILLLLTLCSKDGLTVYDSGITPLTF